MEYSLNFLKYLAEAESKDAGKVGESVRKETSMSTATTEKSRDAARKRSERASKPKKSQLPKSELLKQILPVKTNTGQVELIYKDSYNSKYHQIIDPQSETTLEKAQSITKEENFVQTQASQQLFGSLEKKAAAKQKKREKEAVTDNRSSDMEGPEPVPQQFTKPKKMSIDDLIASFGKTDPVQMGSMPFDLRQEFFLQNRDPMSDKEFDSLSYETVANQFGIADIDLSFNEQITNAIVTLARIKAGAGDQELSFLANIKNGAYTKFGKEAFDTAKKMLSQFGDRCIQLMVTASEAGLGSSTPEGNVEFACDQNRFTVNAQGEISLSTKDFTQHGKHSRSTLQRSLAQTLQDPLLMQQDAGFGETLSALGQMTANLPMGLIDDNYFSKASKDPAMAAFLQAEPVISASGQNLGPMMMPSGEMNPAISYKVFEKMTKKTLERFITSQRGAKGVFTKTFMQNAVTNKLRGDGSVVPEAGPTHLVTVEGLFPLSNEYFAAVAANSDISIKSNEKEFGLQKSKINKFKVVVEQTEQPMDPAMQMDPYMQMREMLNMNMIPVNPSPIDLFSSFLMQNFVIDMNFSLLPGMKPKDIHGVEYNKIKVHGKTFKIPVARDQELVAASFEESYLVANNLLLESLENDDVLRALYETNLLSFEDAQIIVETRYDGIENCKDLIVPVLNKMSSLLTESPNLVMKCAENLQEAKKRKRNYKREYKLFHGKPSQIKKRAARVKARRKMEKKGLVRKGDGKDVDHKRPLRNGGTSSDSNIRVRSKSANRADNGKYKGQPADKPRTDK
jgi:hypothetical protein